MQKQKVVHVFVSPEVHQQIKVMCAERGQSQAEFITALVQNAAKKGRDDA